MAVTCFDRVMYVINLASCMVELPIIWRFPYVYFQSGGGVFLIPYLLAMFVCALPATVLDLLFCQFSSRGPGRRWIICPLFQGIGYGMVVVNGIVSIYYSVILAWSLYYLFGTFSEFLPWTLCTNEWNTDLCVGVNSRTNSSSLVSGTGLSHMKTTTLSPDVTTHMVSSSEEYWSKHLLQMTTGIDDPGTVQWKLVLCLLGVWLLAFICIFTVRIRTSTDTARHLAVIGVYVVLVSMLIRGSLLPGAGEGIKYYFVPQWERFLDIKVWRNAVAQAFFAVSIGWGKMSNIASFNGIHNNCYKDAVAIIVSNCLASLFIGFIVFLFLGNMANETKLPVSDVVNGGPGLAIMVYSKAVSTMPGSQLCSAILFLSLFIIGLENVILCVNSVLVGMYDALRRSTEAFKAVLCCAGLILGLSCITQGGIYVLSLMDWYIASISVLVLVVAEVLVLAWIYGKQAFYEEHIPCYVKHLLQMTTGIDDPGTVQWKLVLCLLGVWLLAFICIFTVRIRTSTDTARHLAVIGVYVVLVSMLIRGSLLPGAGEGIKYYFVPQWERFLDIKVWRNAVAQAFFAVSIGWGKMSNIASFNGIHNNCYKDAVAIIVSNCLASLFIGFIVFLFLGNMANETKLPVSDVVNGGPGLAIMVYSKAVSTMPGSQLCSAILFLSLFIIGLENVILCVNSVLVGMYDALRRSTEAFKAVLCCAGLILGLSCITQGGIYVLSLMDWYIASI
ncbi:sodium- and chloride-dependent betaine transporter-like [Haliotis asinina]|uniref:sodium- and chloride-dependent betaine transporter-like n=1 Tax=Haliotis asinina TaxID=109174 RepID=UPI003531B48A